METGMVGKTYGPQTSLNRTMQYGNAGGSFGMPLQMTFKSYYVVWKLFCYVYKYILFLRLNRTMQYGNSPVPPLDGKVYVGLNRTMQYGNPFPLVGHLCEFQSLNRTMQYGNNVRYHLFASKSPCLNRTMQYGNCYRHRQNFFHVQV